MGNYLGPELEAAGLGHLRIVIWDHNRDLMVERANTVYSDPAAARSMINDLNRWTVGWIDWNLLLDHHGGPNHVANFCSAPCTKRY